MTAHSSISFKTRELKPGFGIEILGVDLATASDAECDAIAEAFQRHGVLLLRNQQLDPAALSKFGARFGTLEPNKQLQYTVPGYPETYILSNKEVDGKRIGAHFDGITWHTDGTYLEYPPMLTLLYGIETPPEGGDTLIADAVAAFASLPEERRAAMLEMQALHSYAWFQETRKINTRTLTDEEKAETPDVVHPFVRTHPVDGRKALFLSTGAIKSIFGMPDEEARALVKEMAELVTQEQFVYTHKWQPGDLLIWDDRCTLHKATEYDDKKYFREMNRVWVRGERPF